MEGHHIPVRPKSPTFSLGLTSKDTPCNTAGKLGAYLMTRLLTDIIALLSELIEGQYAGGRLPSTIAGGSWGSSRYSITRSIELKKVQKHDTEKINDLLKIQFQRSYHPARPIDAVGEVHRTSDSQASKPVRDPSGQNQ
jgi:hypothetical protein